MDHRLAASIGACVAPAAALALGLAACAPAAKPPPKPVAASASVQPAARAEPRASPECVDPAAFTRARLAERARAKGGHEEQVPAYLLEHVTLDPVDLDGDRRPDVITTDGARHWVFVASERCARLVGCVFGADVRPAAGRSEGLVDLVAGCTDELCPADTVMWKFDGRLYRPPDPRMESMCTDE